MFLHRRNLISLIVTTSKLDLHPTQIRDRMRSLDPQLRNLKHIITCHRLSLAHIALADQLENFFHCTFIFSHQDEHLAVLFKEIDADEEVVFVCVLQNEDLASLVLVHCFKAGNFCTTEVHYFAWDVVKRVNQLQMFVKGSIEYGLIHPQPFACLLNFEIREFLI